MPIINIHIRHLIVTAAVLFHTAAGAQIGPRAAVGEYPVMNNRDVLYGGARSDKTMDIFQTNTGEYLLVGETHSESEGGGDMLLLKVGEDFSEQFRRSYGSFGNDGANAVVQAHDGGYVLAGYGMPGRRKGWGGTDALLLKTDEDGVPIWSNYFGSEGEDVFRDILQLEDGRFVLAGTKNRQCWIVCIDRNGEKTEWEFLLPGETISEGVGLTLTRDRKIAVTGYVDKPKTKSKAAVLLIKLDEAGNLLFQKEIQSGDAARGMQILELEDGGLAIAGIAFSAAYRDDMCLIITDADGNLRFEPRPYGDTGEDQGHAVVQEWDGNLILGGATMSHMENAKRSNLWLRKVSPQNGNSQWSKNVKEDLGYLQTDVCNALLINHQGYLLSAGFSNRPGKGNEAWLIQFDNAPVVQPVLPNQIKVEAAKLYEWDQNGEINPEERCYLGFYLKNTAAATARGLVAEIRQIKGDSGIVFPASVRLPAVFAGGRAKATIPLLGTENLTPGEYQFEIVLRDAFKQEMSRFPIKVRSNTRPQANIRLSAAKFSARKDGMPERGGTVKFQFNLENAGNRIAEKVEMNVSVSGNIPLRTAVPHPGDLNPYSQRNIQTSFTIPANYPSDTVTVLISAVDERGELTVAGQYTLILDEPAFVLPDSLRKAGTRAIVWQKEFKSLADSTIYEKQLTAKAILVSDHPLRLDQVAFTRNQTEALPILKAARMVLLQSEDGIYIYKLHLPFSLSTGMNDLQISCLQDTDTLKSANLRFRFEAPKPRLFVYSIGVPLQQEGLQYSLQNARDVNDFWLENKSRDYYRTIDTRLITDSVQTEFYKLRKLFLDIRARARREQFLPQDVLLIYISAQATDKVKGTFKIKASGYDGVEVETSALDFEDVCLYLLEDQDIRCHKVLLLDVFSAPAPDSIVHAEMVKGNDGEREGEGVEVRSLGASFAAFQSEHKNLISLMACSPGEIGYEDSRWSNSALAEAVGSLSLRENLVLCDTNLDHEVTLSEFYQYLRRKTPELTRSAGYPPQTPLLIKENGNLKDFTLFSY